MQRIVKMHKYFDIIMHGKLFDGLDDNDPVGIDHVETHRNRDRILIGRIKTMGEVLRHGMAEPRKVGEQLIELAEEAETIERETCFGFE